MLIKKIAPRTRSAYRLLFVACRLPLPLKKRIFSRKLIFTLTNYMYFCRQYFFIALFYRCVS